MTTLSCDVLVVGSGPAGSATAAALAHAGRDVVLVEAHRHPRPKACAEYASPRISDELAWLGVAEAAWRPFAVPLDGMHVIRDEERVPITYHDRSGPRTAWGLDRLRFDAALAEHAVASGARFLDRTSLVGLRLGEATLRNGNGPLTIRHRWLVGADGARSRVARQLGVERPVRAPRRLGLVAHYEGVPELTSHGEMHVGGHGYIGLAPTPDGQLNVGMALPLDDVASATTRFDAAIAALPAVAARLAGRRRLTAIRGVGPIGHRVAATAGPGWLLVGDAAGFVDPFTGEGIYRALRSARAAATALAAGDEGAMERYRAARRAAFSAKDGLTWLVQGLLAAPPLLAYALRRLERRPAAAAVLGAALGDCRPASTALAPSFVAQVLWP